MERKLFSRTEALSFGWKIMKENIGFFIVVLIIMGVIQFAPQKLADSLQKSKAVLASLGVSIIATILNVLVQMGAIKICLKLYDGQKAELVDLFLSYRKFFSYLFASILYFLIAIGGLILLIVPGIIWMIRFQFFGYFIVDKDLGPVQALKKSYAITKGNAWNLLIFGILTIGVIILGILALLIGLFAAIPTVMVAVVFVYRFLLKQEEPVVQSG